MTRIFPHARGAHAPTSSASVPAAFRWQR
jgi:hypothetical protein